MKVIHIFLDVPADTPHDQVWEAVKREDEYIETNCVNFFSTEMLDYGYNVIVFRGNGYIDVKELLENKQGQYTPKYIRKAHNICKMLLAGSFSFEGVTMKSVDNLSRKTIKEAWITASLKNKKNERPKKGGWSPGNYISSCTDCNRQFIGDKRATQCSHCAYKEEE